MELLDVLRVEDYETLSLKAADLVEAEMRRRPDLVLGLATGHTPVGMYRELVRRHREEGLSFSRLTTFNLDEYLGLPADHPWAFRRYMEEHLFRHVDLDRERIHFLDGAAPDPEAECDRYEAAIEAVGGIDCQVLGIGRNGHIGFNEPGTPFERDTHVITLKESTLLANFGRTEDVPRRALTMGIKTIMRSRRILLLASGEDKAEAVERTLRGPVTPDVPASVLQLHPNVTFLLDTAAAERL